MCARRHAGTPTNHTDVNLVGDAVIYLCPCPEPPCEPDPLPATPGHSTSVFGCLSDTTLNLSHAVCTVFHKERSNVTCVTPTLAVACDVPGFDSNASLLRWWDNAELPSRSYYSPNVTAISCIVRPLGDRPLPAELGGFTDALALQEALSVERCEVVCKRICQTVCSTDHLSVHSLLPELNDWEYDRTIDNNPREFVDNGTLYQERSPAQYLRGATPDYLGQERSAINVTCTLPTLSGAKYELVMGAPHANLSAQQGIFDMFGRRFNGQNVFDLALYVALHAFEALEGKTCITPFPNASRLDLLPGEDSAHLHSLVCHEPTLERYNVSLGPAPHDAYGRQLQQLGSVQGQGQGQHSQWEGEPRRAASLDGGAVAARAPGLVARGDEASEAAEVMDAAEVAEMAETAAAMGQRGSLTEAAKVWDDVQEWGEGNGTEWDWRHAHQLRAARNGSHTPRRWRGVKRSPPRRRLLYHEFEIERSPWDFWVDESAVETQARLERKHAELSGDCRFYHNCTDPLPPPLLLHEFACWLPNTTEQPNVTTVPPRSLATLPRRHAINENTTFEPQVVSCIRPSWPNSTGISCLTPRTAITCPYTDSYRGNLTEVLASNGTYLNQTTSQCTTWPLERVYRHAADAGQLFSVGVNRSYQDPWERPCDQYVRVAVGDHHYCAIDVYGVLRCSGHDAHGRASLDWSLESGMDEYGNTVEMTVRARAALARVETGTPWLVDTPAKLLEQTRVAAAAYPPGRFRDVCAGQYHTCAVEDLLDPIFGNLTGTALRCWGQNYSLAIDADAVNALMDASGRGGPQRVVCGRRFVCALQPTEQGAAPSPGQTGGLNWRAFCSGIVQDRFGSEHSLPSPLWPVATTAFTDFEAGGEFACGTRSFQLNCYGNSPPQPISLSPAKAVVGLAIGAHHVCAALLDDSSICFSGSSFAGPADSEWLTETVEHLGPWSAIASISLGDSVACVVDHDGQGHCGGERAQIELNKIRAPVRLQPERLDLVERGVTLSSVHCGGVAARNGTLVQLGEQYCCGISHAQMVHCWGLLPPHHGLRLPRVDVNPQGTREMLVPLGERQPLNESNSSVFFVYNRRCVPRTRFLRDFGLKLLLDTHPSVSLADGTTNFTQPYLCYDVPRRWTADAGAHAIAWLGVNITNTSQLFQIRSWHTTMLLVLNVASYTDELSCFNFSHPFQQLHCAALIPYINRTVELVVAPPKPFTIERISATDFHTTKYTLAHTAQPDQYCFEKLRLTPSEQFQRGAAWHRATQRVVDGFEAIFAFQIDNAARLCKTVRALVTGVLLYERCQLTGSDGLALVLRGGGPAAALGGGGSLLGYGGLNRSLAIEIDTWYNADMGDLYYNHVSVQAGGPNSVVGAHREQYLSAAMLDPSSYPEGLGDGKAHVLRVRYTPGLDTTLLHEAGPTASPNHLKYWVEQGAIGAATFPHPKAVGSWARKGTGILRVYLDALDVPLLALPIDLPYTLGLEDGRAWVGLTGATGRRFQNHYALSWQFCEGPTGCPSPMSACEAFGCNPLFPSARYENSVRDSAEAYRDLATGVPAPQRPSTLLDAATLATTPRRDTTPAQAQWQAGPDEPPESVWGDEPDGWKVQYKRPESETVTDELERRAHIPWDAAGGPVRAGHDSDTFSDQADDARGTAAVLTGSVSIDAAARFTATTQERG